MENTKVNLNEIEDPMDDIRAFGQFMEDGIDEFLDENPEIKAKVDELESSGIYKF